MRKSVSAIIADELSKHLPTPPTNRPGYFVELGEQIHETLHREGCYVWREVRWGEDDESVPASFREHNTI